ncbi:TatD family hydrolase [Niveispirillum irakense]|uniref:TatD family hydrolase n=1 Tax=Niveispirillum irakense TaxID=34011 RepID=UPI0003FD7906|nr:TatD family hydrolase [Niveispirillum irakense]
MLVDSHCHLDFPDFAPERDAVVQRARDAGVGLMLSICTHISKFNQVLDIAQSYPDVFCTLGVHPHQAAEEFPHCDVEKLVELSRLNPKVVGIGETGLDYFYDKSPRDIQQESFRRHIRVCLETDLPVIVHTRDADEDTIRILREEGQGRLRGLLHCFSSGRQLAEEALELGFYISLSGIVTFKKSEDLRAIAADVPLDRILVETDAPYLAPVPMRGKRNEPAFVAHTARHMAEVKGVSEAELAQATTENFRRLFTRVPAAALAVAA